MDDTLTSFTALVRAYKTTLVLLKECVSIMEEAVYDIGIMAEELNRKHDGSGNKKGE